MEIETHSSFQTVGAIINRPAVAGYEFATRSGEYETFSCAGDRKGRPYAAYERHNVKFRFVEMYGACGKYRQYDIFYKSFIVL